MSSITASGLGGFQAIQTETTHKQPPVELPELVINRSIREGLEDATRLILAERLNSGIQGMNQAVLNINDGISIAQVVDASLEQIQLGQSRLQELAVQGTDDSLTSKERKGLQEEASHIQEQIQTIVGNSEFNDIPLLSNNETLTLQTGADAGDQTKVKLTDFSQTFSPIDLLSKEGASSAVVSLATEASQVGAKRTEMGNVESDLSTSASQLTTFTEALSAGTIRIHNADIAEQTTRNITAAIRAHASVALNAQANNLTSARVNALVR